MTRSGKFMVFEGIDGAGTTTQTKLLADALEKKGVPVVRTFEPSAGPVGKLIKEFLQARLDFNTEAGDFSREKTLALLFAADRLHHLANTVNPELLKGTHVVSDRYVLSSLAYQSVDAPAEWVAQINSLAREPDLYIFLRIGIGDALARIGGRGDERELFEHRDKLEKISASYERLLDGIPAEKLLVIDGTASIKEIHEQSLERVLEIMD